MPSQPVVITYGKPDGFRNVHVGHLSGVVLHADAYARYCRSSGKETWLISGTDGYGAAVYQHAFEHFGHIPSDDELRTYVYEYHMRQRATLAAYHVSNDYYGLDTDADETKRIKDLCDEALSRLQAGGHCVLRKEINYVDPILQCPLGNRQLTKEETAKGEQKRSQLTGTLAACVQTENWYLSLEAYRPVIEASMQRFDDDIRDRHLITYVRNILRQPLPDYRLTTQQPWAIQVNDDPQMKYQVWVESLLAPVAYLQHAAAFLGKTVEKPRYVQFIAEDTLFFYTIVQPVLWHIMWPEMKLSTLLCNRTRSFVDGEGKPCFMTGDELLQYFTADQIRLCMISRGTGRSVIAFTKGEMNRLWKRYLHVEKHAAVEPSAADVALAQQYWKRYERCLEKLNFSKAVSIADEYFHTRAPAAETCRAMMHFVAPGFSINLEGN